MQENREGNESCSPKNPAKILDVDNSALMPGCNVFFSLKKNALLEKVAALEWKVTFSMHKNC